MILIKSIVALGAIVALANGFVASRPGGLSSPSRFSLPDEVKNDEFPTSASVPNSLKVDGHSYGNLLDQLEERVSAEHKVKASGYFPSDVESDDWDELEFLETYDESMNEDNFDELINNLPINAAISTKFGKHEFSFSKVLTVAKNGTKTFAKVRQGVSSKGDATTSFVGSLNTTLTDTTSASASIAANVTISTKGQDQKITASGDVTIKASSKLKVEKRRLFSESTVETTSTLKLSVFDDPLTIKTSVHSGAESFRLPFRSFITLFGAQFNQTTDYGVNSGGKVGGEVTSRIAFANKNSSLTKSCIKAYVWASGSALNSDEDDEDQSGNGGAATTDAYQVVLIKAKSHTWTKVVSASKSQVVVDVVTCTKSRAYAKGVAKGKSVTFAGTGGVSWEGSQITISGDDLSKISSDEYGVHFIQKQIQSNSLVNPDMSNIFG